MSYINKGQYYCITLRAGEFQPGTSRVRSIVSVVFGDEKPEGQKSKLNIIRPLRMSKLISSEEHDRIVGSRLSTSSKNVPLSKIYTSKTVWTFTSAWFFTAFTINLFTTLPTRYSEWVSS